MIVLAHLAKIILHYLQNNFTKLWSWHKTVPEIRVYIITTSNKPHNPLSLNLGFMYGY
jgi:hypothetical protein